MKDVERAAAIRGKTIRFAWTEGPTKGQLVGFASSAKEWYPVRGTLQVMKS